MTTYCPEETQFKSKVRNRLKVKGWIKIPGRDFLAVRWLRLCLSMQEASVQFLVREPRSHRAKEPKHGNRNNVVINSIKTLNMAHTKESFLKYHAKQEAGVNLES